MMAQPGMEWVVAYPDYEPENRGQYGGGFRDVFITANDEFVACGRHGLNHQWIKLLNAAREERFDLRFQGSQSAQFLNSIIETDNGDFVAAGWDNGTNQGDISVARVSSEGELLWHRNYGGGGAQGAYAVIELKDGDFLVSGFTSVNNYDALAYKLDGEGNTIWARNYGSNGRDQFSAIREVDGGYLFAGSLDRRCWLLKVNPEGQQVWSRTYTRGGERQVNETFLSLSSFPSGGYVACGISAFADDNYSVRPIVVRVDADGEQIWLRVQDEGIAYGRCIIASRNGDRIVMVGDNGNASGVIWQFYEDGSLVWSRILSPNPRPVGVHVLYSTLLGDDGGIVSAGWGNSVRGTAGIIIKYAPERMAPRIIRFTPAEQEFDKLPGTIVEFHIEAEDAQGDVLEYYYLINGDTIQQGQDLSYRFDSLGVYEMTGIATDGRQFDSINWTIHVRNLFIITHTPDTLSLTVQRNSEIDFSLDSVAYIGDRENLRFEWLLYDSAAVRWEEVAGDDRIGIRSYAFDRTGGYALKARVFDPNVDPEPADSVQWAIQVRGVIRAFEPNLPELSLEPRQEATFELIPFNANNDSIQFWWTLNEADTLSTQ
ncbi:MAG: hypothetical protein FJY67_09980, partial [Calditrichaeota bacterium]|nr:hypothetical protein [Calditrichota bacterium]